MSDPQLITLTNADKRFYPLVGPFLARRAVHKAVGGEIWDDDGKTWIVALTAAGAVTGFVGLHRGRVESLYTLPDHRDQATALVAGAVAAAGDKDLRAIVARPFAPSYEAAGFIPYDETANFIKLTRKATR